jgi:uncharacterized membrane protein
MFSTLSTMGSLTPVALTGDMRHNEQLTNLVATAGTHTANPTTGTVATLVVAAVLTGLVAGTYFAYACSVMLALGRTSDRTFIEVMQKINVAIQNPVFFAALFGAPFASGVAVWLQSSDSGGVSGWTIAALALNLVGFLVTVAANIPLNNALDAAGEPAALADPAAMRRGFERVWNAWNTARGVVTAVAAVCLALALSGR